MDSTSQEIAFEILPVIRAYKDGRVERLIGSEIVPPSLEDPESGVSSKDITISQNSGLSARLYLLKLSNSSSDQEKLPILVYFHGGGFCIESAFSLVHQRYLNKLVEKAKVVAVSVEYRKAPEYPLPIAYDDCWDALQWVVSHSHGQSGFDEPWLTKYADFNRLFLGGDSAGANIVHNIAMRAGEHGLNQSSKILGAYLVHPYFWGSNRIGSEDSNPYQQDILDRIWVNVSPYGIDDPKINPMGPNAPCLSQLGCTRVLVTVAGNDPLKNRGRLYYDELKKSEWEGEVEFFEVEGEGHAFHFINSDSENAETVFKRLASFLNLPSRI
ncbi:2-hydroxyisoflavanone dehydratase [Thalictrum thalictroides]|uniref:2-hydroxyisoflavanone dehydratase n=1 Tax=Thalictrum thalictroides TaxID=46969 RepID=A0A7J6X330_THATH|nr:2-hydroxyisoflavanone dehydratase [Thalictrum thalictroides]